MHMDSIEINSNSRLRPRKIQKKCLLTLYVAGELIHERLFVNEPWWMSFSGKKALMNIFSWISLVLKGVDFHRIYVNVKNRYSKNQWIYLSVWPFVAGSLTCKRNQNFDVRNSPFIWLFDISRRLSIALLRPDDDEKKTPSVLDAPLRHGNGDSTEISWLPSPVYRTTLLASDIVSNCSILFS